MASNHHSRPNTIKNYSGEALDQLSDILLASLIASGGPTRQDAFGRQRVSSATSTFDTKFTHSAAPLHWDDQEISGGTTSTAWDVNRAGVSIGVAETTAGLRRRQTFQRFDQQPGRSRMVVMSSVPVRSGGGPGVVVRMGLFDDSNGFGVSIEDGIFSFFVRSNATGTPVDTTVTQSNWSVDNFDGNGPSSVDLDPGKSQILWMDYDWMGAGSIRFGWVINGQFITAHEHHSTNSIGTVYASTTDLPLRHEVENDGTGTATLSEQLSASIISETGATARAILHTASTNGLGITPADGAVAAAVGLRLKSTHLATHVDPYLVSIINEGNTPGFEWRVIFNPDVAGTWTYAPLDNSGVEVAVGAVDGSNLVTNGTVLASGVGTGIKQAQLDPQISSSLRLGAAIDGTVDQLVIAIIPFGAESVIDVSLNWRERT